WTTNNRMELRACIEALKALRVPSDVVLFSDSSYVVNAMTKGWLGRWQRNGWTLSTGEPVKNEDLWRELAAACDRHKVEFRWVRGHAGTAENERADELAVAAARGVDLDIDEGFEAGSEEGAA
ncbi:MAG TPA: ribonuclease H, partial [Anaerolineae bacterium]|nr:ribonuclease H [Anaerolineae bacterium]